MEALLSDLIFKHALRIRPQGTEKNESFSDETKLDSQATQTNLVGTINNHVTVDLKSVTDAKDTIPTGKPLET
jgi:hypothetical protein